MHKNDLDASYIEVPVPPGQQQYAKLDGRRMKQWVNDITGVARNDRDSGNKYWGRIAGSAVTHPLFDDRFAAIPLYRGTPWFLPIVGVYYRLLDRLQ